MSDNIWDFSEEIRILQSSLAQAESLSSPPPGAVETPTQEQVFAAVYALAERCCTLGPSGKDEFWQTTPEWAEVVRLVKRRNRNE